MCFLNHWRKIQLRGEGIIIFNPSAAATTLILLPAFPNKQRKSKLISAKSFFKTTWNMEESLNITQFNFLFLSHLLADAWGKLIHHYSSAPRHEISLCCHLTPGSVVVHLPDPFNLTTSPETNIRWRCNLQAWTSKSWGRKRFFFTSMTHQ